MRSTREITVLICSTGNLLDIWLSWIHCRAQRIHGQPNWHYRQDENTPNAVVSYYVKGSLVALCLDLTIRAATQGKKSLDDVMRVLWKRYGMTGTGVEDRELELLAEEVSGVSLKGFFDLAVRSTRELPLEKLLAAHGIRMTRRTARSNAGLAQ